MIPECPIKQTIFGPQRSIRDDKSFGRLLNYYIKEIPALPAALVKSEMVTNFFSLKESDLAAPGVEQKYAKVFGRKNCLSFLIVFFPFSKQKKKKRTKIEISEFESSR